MAVLEISDDTFQEEVINSTSPTLVDFWAEWCGPCQMMSPVIHGFADTHTEKIKVCKLNTDKNPQTAQKYQITGIPCLILFNQEKEVARITGYRTETALEEEIKKHITL